MAKKFARRKAISHGGSEMGRLDWCEQEKKKAEEWGDAFHAVFLDDKWFYLDPDGRK